MTEIKIITKELLKKWSACTDGFIRFCTLFPAGADLETAINGLVEDGHDDWGKWLFDKCKESNLFPEIILKGYRNVGDRNVGDWNVGNWNVGYGNVGDRNAGFFNTIKPCEIIFNQPSNLNFDSEIIQKLIRIIQSIKPILVWIYEADMTEEEKSQNPTYKTTGGYLKKREYKYCWQRGWLKFTQDERDFIQSLPNFSWQVFTKITGIKQK